ncbi:hypothetical protein AM1_0396 [Acaryochloris marina MBIC11017]|uniref:PIN domain-containing protein n=1 Tax=Acaryochloris marina (strain MBIC 11017) TaxID=329726 RepID=B0CAW3_ACAM1|nr:hypothetical protein AM1_0396 [Acaryochloris marina MBIC11017]
MIFVLDSSPLSQLTNPNQEHVILSQWLKKAVQIGHIIAIPEIAYYEVRRELIRLDRPKSVQRLDEFCQLDGSLNLAYIPISTEIMRKASQLWAWARQTGQQTASNEALDADVILAATSIVIAQENSLPSMVVTKNVRHIARYTPAEDWEDISLNP